MYSGITLINKRQRQCNLECSCRLWFFSRVFSPQCPTQLLPTHIAEHTQKSQSQPSYSNKQGCGSCKQFQQTHGTDTIQPHKKTAQSCFEGLLYEAERRSQILVCTVCILSGNSFFHVLVGRDVCVRKTVVCSATQFLRVVQLCKGLIYIKNGNNRDQE